MTNSKGGVGYNWTTEEIAGYVGEKYTSTGSYIRTAVLMLEVPTPDWPPPPIATKTPATVNQIDQEIFKEIICMYVKLDTAVARAMKSLYNLIWGQCSESLQPWLCGYITYN